MLLRATSGASQNSGGEDSFLGNLITESISLLVTNPSLLGKGKYVTNSVENVGIFSSAEVPIPSHWVEEMMVDADLIDGGDFGGANDEQRKWLQIEAQRVLESACRNLRLPIDGDSNPVDRPELVRMGRHELLKEKKLVKHELKRYDTLFKQNFGRLPSRWEKEPMRPLYTYYRKLKQLLGMWEGRTAGEAPQSIPEHDELVATSGPGQPRRANDGMRETTQALQQMDINRQRSAGSSGAGSGAKEDTGKRFTVTHDMDAVMATVKGTTVDGSGSQPGSVVTAQSLMDNSVPELEARLRDLNTKKNSIRAILQKYQEKFIVDHRRKIRYHRDILPIEREYRTYKHVKEDIAKVESALEKLGGNLGKKDGENSPGSDLGM